MRRPVPITWLGRPVHGRRGVAVGDVALAAVLSVGAVTLASGLVGARHPHQGVGAAVAILLMTAPVAIARRTPVMAAGVLAIGAAFNWLVVGDLVRCGAALPAAFYVAFAIGLRCLRRIDMAASLVFVASNLVCQAFSDPQLGLSALPTLAPIASAFVVIGVLLRVRSTAVEVLRVRTTELREQRERNAQLAVEADQARIAADLDDFLRDRVTQMAHDAAVGRAALESDPERAAGAFIAIQHTGRDTLMRMRGVVATLRDTAMVEPQPVLAQLDRLLGRSAADTRLHVCGDPRLLSPGVELSGYRIVEHLLVALDNDPAAHIDVRVTFGADALKLDVSGPPAPRGDARAALAAATERVATHGGTLRTRATVGRRETVVLIPLASNGHA